MIYLASGLAILGFIGLRAYIYRTFYFYNLPPRIRASKQEIYEAVLKGVQIRTFYEELLFAARVLSTRILHAIPRTAFITSPIILIGDIKFARLILEGDDKIPPAPKNMSLYRNFDKITLGLSSLLSKESNNESWIICRKKMAPCFSMQNLLKSIGTHNEIFKKLNKRLEDAALNNNIIDISSLLINFTLDFLTDNMFGENFHALDEFDENGQETIGKQFLTSLKMTIKEYTLLQVAQPLRRYHFWNKDVQNAKKAVLFLKDFSQGLLDRYRRRMSQEDSESDISIIGHLQRIPYLSDLERCADIILFLLAGHDTTAYTLSWIILLISRHPDVLNKIQSELDEINPNPSQPFDPTHLSKLDYINNVIKEGMRLYPVTANASFRVADRQYEVDGFTIPKGCRLNVSTYAIGRLGIENSDDFIPERWNKDAPQYQLLLETHFPFGLGKRNCIGQNLAMLEIKLVVCNLFRSFYFKPANESQSLSFTHYMTTKPNDPFLRVYQRY